MEQQNFLSTTGFGFNVNRLKNVSFFVQSVNIPGVSMSPSETLTPFTTIYRHGDRIAYDDLTLTIRCDEDMNSFLEIYSWMSKATKAQGFSGYKQLKDSIDEGLYSDATLIILDSRKNPNKIFSFIDIFPIALSSMRLDVTPGDIQYATFDVTFKYATYEFESL